MTARKQYTRTLDTTRDPADLDPSPLFDDNGPVPPEMVPFVAAHWNDFWDRVNDRDRAAGIVPVAKRRVAE